MANGNRMAELRNGGMIIEQRNGGMAEWWNRRTWILSVVQSGFARGMAEWRMERMAEWSNGRNGYIRTIYGRHTHTDNKDDDDDNDNDDGDDDDTLKNFIVQKKQYQQMINISLDQTDAQYLS